MKKVFRVILEEDKEDDGFVVTCPMLPGCISQGDTKEEALVNIKEAIMCYLEAFEQDNDPLPKLEECLVEIE